MTAKTTRTQTQSKRATDKERPRKPRASRITGTITAGILLTTMLVSGTAQADECTVDVFAALGDAPRVVIWQPKFAIDAPYAGSATVENAGTTTLGARINLGKWLDLDGSQTDSGSDAITTSGGTAVALYQRMELTQAPNSCASPAYWYVSDYTPSNNVLEEKTGDLSGLTRESDRDNINTPNAQNTEDPSYGRVDTRMYTEERTYCSGTAERKITTKTSKIFVVGLGITWNGVKFEGRISTNSDRSYTYVLPAGHCWAMDYLGKGKGMSFEYLGADDGSLCNTIAMRLIKPHVQVPQVPQCSMDGLDTGEPPEALLPDELP